MDVLLLGPIEARLDGRTIPLGAHKQRALLALLALHANRPVSSERIIEGLWGEEPPPSAGKMVQLYVSRLRRALPGDGATIVTRDGGYELRLPDEAVDAVRFERLVAEDRPREALALWRGEALADVRTEPFAEIEARRLEELRVRAAELAIEEDLGAGRHAEVLAELELLVGEHPLRERLQAHRMLALYRTGRQADALDAFRAARAALVEQVGVEPGEDLRRLHEAILQHDPALGAPSRARRSVPASAVAGGSAVPEDLSRRLLAAGAVVVAMAVLVFGLTRVVGGDARAQTLREGVVGAIDPHDGSVETQIMAGDPALLVAGANAVWVGDAVGQTITRVDDGGRRLVTIDVGRRPTALAFGAGALWATLDDGTLVRVEPGTNRVSERRHVGNGPAALAVGYGAVWIADPVDSTVVRADVVPGRPLRRIPLSDAPTAVAAGAGAVWAVSESGASVVRIDPHAAAPVATVRVGEGARAPAIAGGALWLANAQDGTVSRIDPASDAVTASLSVGRDPVALTGAGSDLYVGRRGAPGIVHIDAAARSTRGTLAIGAAAGAMALSGGRLWAATLVSPARHRGGELRVAVARAGIDPADSNAYFPEGVVLERLLYDGLVAYRRAPGGAGAAIVPRLATAVPRPEDGGRTYRFRLRDGLRFSDGAPVRASDVRRSLERELRLAAGWLPPYYDRIAGARGCRRTPARCRLRGVQTDDGARTVTIRLTAPDPDLLHKLTLPFASVLEGGGPPRVAPGTAPLGTGPYRVARYRPDHALRLERNARFAATDGRPGGEADVIDVAFSPDTKEGARLDAALNGRTDVAMLTRLSRRADRERAGRQPWRLVHIQTPQTEMFFLNTRVAPFDDVRVRRAINFAVDRERLASALGDAGTAKVACELLPPGIPEREPRCPWTLDPRPGGGWRAPDLERARRLVAASGTRGMRVTVHVPTGVTSGGEVARALQRLGYRARVRHYAASEDYIGTVSAPAARQQIGWNGWLADYLTPAGFLDALVTCAARPPEGSNLPRHCDRRLDRGLDRAAAGSLPWRQAVDRIDRAATWLPLAHLRDEIAVGDRAHDVMSHPVEGLMLEQIWVR